MINLPSTIPLYRPIFAQKFCKLHFIDLQYFLRKFPTIGSCQESDELILKLHRTCKIRFNIILPSTPKTSKLYLSSHTRLHLVPSLSSDIHALSYIPSWCGQGRLYFSLSLSFRFPSRPSSLLYVPHAPPISFF